jgi:2-polyprenyl-6-methoxyphenol hydroxylase-like FAD-dependent oxidoreductase
MSAHYDVAIAGGGPAGAATGIALARSGCKVLIANAPSGRAFPIGETAPPDICVELARLGCRESFLRDAHPRSQRMCSIWGSEIPQFRDSFATPLGCGWHLSRSRFEATLLAEAESLGVDLRHGARMVSATRPRDCWRVKLRSADGECLLRARFLVDATGRAAILARGFGARRMYLDRLTAVYAVFHSTPQTVSSMSAIESFKEGWWYAACPPLGQTVVALFSDSDLVRSRSFASPAVWSRLLEESSLVKRLVTPDGAQPNLKVCSAASQLAQCGGAGWICVGDAAIAWDPLSSAGITMALRSGMEASEAIQASLAGDHSAIECYTRRILFRNNQYMAEKAMHYSAEKRWPEEPFWKRRTAAGREISI